MGQVCEIVQNDPRHLTMPKVFPDRIGQRIVITKLMDDYVWAHDDKPVAYRINRFGRRVVEFDPRGVESLYRIDDIRVVG